MSVLSYIASLTLYISTAKVHPVLFPFPWITTLHAARITNAFRGRTRALRTEGQLGRGPEYAGFLLMCWGGGMMSNFLMFQPPPQLLSIQPYINYLAVHVLFGYVIDLLPSPKVIDTALPLIDAIMRTGSICGAVQLAHTHSNPAIASSLSFQLLIGAVASAGGSVTASTLGVWNQEWSLRVPPFLRGGLIDTLDLWSGSLAAAVYGCLLGLHPAYEPYTRFLSGQGEKYVAGTPLMSPLEARSTTVLVLTALYAFRVYKTHYAERALPASVPVTIKEKAE